MSTQDNVAEHVPAALANVMAHVYRPRFFAKLASLGIQPENAEEAETLVNLGLKLAEMNTEVPTAQSAPAQPVHNKFAHAVNSLERLAFTTEELADHQRKQAAAQLAQDPTLFASAMIVDAYDQLQASAAA